MQNLKILVWKYSHGMLKECQETNITSWIWSRSMNPLLFSSLNPGSISLMLLLLLTRFPANTATSSTQKTVTILFYLYRNQGPMVAQWLFGRSPLIHMWLYFSHPLADFLPLYLTSLASKCLPTAQFTCQQLAKTLSSLRSLLYLRIPSRISLRSTLSVLFISEVMLTHPPSPGPTTREMTSSVSSSTAIIS